MATRTPNTPPERTRPLLFDAFPSLAGALPWLPLARTPTTVEPLPAPVSAQAAGLWMKRDDQISPIYGGNKVRRYEFLLAAARAAGARTLVTAGGLASTQVMATTLFGRALGFAVRAVLFDQPITRFAQRSLLGYVSGGAELAYGGGYASTALRLAAARARTRDSFLILPGAPDPISNLGYLDAMLELAAQVDRGVLPRPDAIVLPTGSSGTLAALALGARWLGWPTEIVGVRITSAIACNRVSVGAIIAATDWFMARRSKDWRQGRGGVRYRLDGSQLGEGYGHPTAAAIDGAHTYGVWTGRTGEVTYSGKAVAAFHRFACSPAARGKHVLLWNTLSSVEPPLAPDAADRVPPSLRWVLEAQPVA